MDTQSGDNLSKGLKNFIEPTPKTGLIVDNKEIKQFLVLYSTGQALSAA